MNRKEINEIKGLFTLENCGIQSLYGCYVNGEKEKVASFGGFFKDLPEEEQHKYFEIFKKTLSGTYGKNTVDMKFTVDAYGEGCGRNRLIKLRDDELKNKEDLEDFYDKIIANYYYTGNYVIFIMNQNYDVPKITGDGIKQDDDSDELYRYILCSICHVNMSKAGLGFDENSKEFHNAIQCHMVDQPDIGFVFPAFTARSEDEDGLLFYTKDTSDFQDAIIDSVLNCEIPMPAATQKETFTELVSETLGEDADYETIKNIHENLTEMIAEQKKEKTGEVLSIDKTEAKAIMERSGVKEENLKEFDAKFDEKVGENGRLMASNIVPAQRFEVKTPDVIVKIKADKTDLVETRIIDGKQCLVIQIDERLEVNGISVNPETGEMIER